MDAEDFLTEFQQDLGITLESDDNDSEMEDLEGIHGYLDQSARQFSDFQWQTDDFTPITHQIDCSPSSGKLDKVETEMNFFKIFVDTALVKFVVSETNKQFLYIKSQCETLSWRLMQWKETSLNEIYLFLGVCMLMTVNSRNTIDEHWSTDPLLYSPIFAETMSRDRFQLILRMLHFCDNREQVAGDRLFKIRFVVDHFKKVFKNAFYPYINDKQEVSMLTTLHPEILTDTEKITHRGEEVVKPESVQHYNTHMEDGDKCDMVLSSVHSSRKPLKWYIKTFMHLMDLSLLNAHILYMRKTGKIVPLFAFKLQVIEQLLNTHKQEEPGTSHRGKGMAELPPRLTEQHFLEKLPPTEKKSSLTAKCIVCTSKKLTKVSRYRCKQCKVTLCIVPCFEKYHTFQNY